MSFLERPTQDTFVIQERGDSIYLTPIQRNIHKKKSVREIHTLPEDGLTPLQMNLPGIPKTKKAETVEVKQKPKQASKPNDSSETAESICLNLKLEENQEQTTEQKLFDYISKLPPSQIRYIVDSYYKNVYPNLIDFNLWKYGEDKLGDGLKDILIEIENIAAKEEKYQIPETFSFISRLRDLY